MIVTLPTRDVSNGKQFDGKEKIEQFYVVGRLDNGELYEFIDCRVYMSKSRTAAVKYASIWIYSNNCYLSGTGKAGGGGYCRTSAAIAEAIASAGIKLDKDISGRGIDMAKDALLAIAKACGAQGDLLVLG